MMCQNINLVTKDVFNKPSKKWIVDDNIIKKINILNNIYEEGLVENDIYLDIVDDYSFAYIYKMLNLESSKLEKYINILDKTLDINKLYGLYIICDYLNIHIILEYLGKCLSNRFNSMNYVELENTVKNLFN